MPTARQRKGGKEDKNQPTSDEVAEVTQQQISRSPQKYAMKFYLIWIQTLIKHNLGYFCTVHW